MALCYFSLAVPVWLALRVFLELSSTYNKDKALQSRFFETPNQRELISASAAVLQDLGFQVEESDSHVGVLRAVKERQRKRVGTRDR